MFLVNVAERCDAMTFRAPIVFEPPEPREQAGKTMSTRSASGFALPGGIKV